MFSFLILLNLEGIVVMYTNIKYKNIITLKYDEMGYFMLIFASVTLTLTFKKFFKAFLKGVVLCSRFLK